MISFTFSASSFHSCWNKMQENLDLRGLQETNVVLQQRGTVSDLLVLTLISTQHTQLGPTSAHRSVQWSRRDTVSINSRDSALACYLIPCRLHLGLNAVIFVFAQIHGRDVSYFHSKGRTHLSLYVISCTESIDRHLGSAERRKVKWVDKFLIISAWEWSSVYPQPSCAKV